jgi:hypothetical protein
MNQRLIVLALGAAALQACGDLFGPSTHGDVARARADWLRNKPASYVFDVTTRSSWSLERSVRVTVQDDAVASAVELPSGTAVANWTLTVELIWTDILNAQEEGDVNSARFDERGIPLSVDLGPWPVDGGRSYAVTNFQRR